MTMQKMERSLEWALGGFDEAMFGLSTFFWQIKNQPPYLSDAEELARLYRSAPELLEPGQVFAPPPAPVVELEPVKLPRLAATPGDFARQYQAYRMQYPSATSTGYPENDRVQALYLERKGAEKAPCVIYLHGWMEFEPGLSLRLPLNWAGPLGMNILALHLPFHFERTPSGKISGELSVTGNLPLALKGLQQAVGDVRQALYWLRARGLKAGLIGKSLGGLVGAIALAAEPGFEAGVLAVPATSTRTSIWQSRYTRLVRRDLTRQGLDEEATARMLEIVRPGRYQPAIDPQRILVFKATADRVCFPSDTDRFTRQWGVKVIEVPTGHLTATFAPGTRRATQEHLRRFL